MGAPEKERQGSCLLRVALGDTGNNQTVLGALQPRLGSQLGPRFLSISDERELTARNAGLRRSEPRPGPFEGGVDAVTEQCRGCGVRHGGLRACVGCPWARFCRPGEAATALRRKVC